MPNKVWDGPTYPFLNFNDCTIKVWKWIIMDDEKVISSHIFMDAITYIQAGIKVSPCY